MKCVFQLISGPDGVRSDVFLADRQELAKLLAERLDAGTQAEDDLVLVVCEISPDFSAVWTKAPLLRVRRFADLFSSGVDYEREVLSAAVRERSG